MNLKSYLSTLSLKERAAFAARVGTSAGHLRNMSYGYRTCAETLAIDIERETGGAVTCEELCPNADWAYVRGTRATRGTRKQAAA